jgi:hypothetical protein
MPRILGVDLPNDKPTHLSLRYLHGIGPMGPTRDLGANRRRTRCRKRASRGNDAGPASSCRCLTRLVPAGVPATTAPPAGTSQNAAGSENIPTRKSAGLARPHPPDGSAGTVVRTSPLAPPAPAPLVPPALPVHLASPDCLIQPVRRCRGIYRVVVPAGPPGGLRPPRAVRPSCQDSSQWEGFPWPRSSSRRPRTRCGSKR